MITAEMVKQLRERTGAGMMDCKKALTDADGNTDKAIEILRERGLAAAAKKAGRIAAEGLVGSYIHDNGRIGVLVEVNIETDFAAANEEFKVFVKDIAMQIAAARPEFVKREDVPTDVLEKEMNIQGAGEKRRQT
jgi:elongation factor Ts